MKINIKVFLFMLLFISAGSISKIAHASDACTDSDGGQNYYVKGYVNLTGYGWDYCSNSTILLEQDCGTDTNGTVLNYGRTAAYICPNGCSDGVCVSMPSIKVVSPDGGDNLKIGETKRIFWESADVSYVRVYIYDDSISGSGSTNYIYENALPASIGYYDWKIQKNQLPGSDLAFPRNYKIRIDGVNTTASGSAVIATDHSNSSFSIADVAVPVCDKNNFAASCNGAKAIVTPNGSPYIENRNADLAIDGDSSTAWMGSWDTNEPTVFILKMARKVSVNTLKIYFDSSKDLPYRASDPTVSDDSIFLPKELQIEFYEEGVWVDKTTDKNIKEKGWRTYSATGDTDEIKFIIPDTWAWNKYAIINEVMVIGSDLGPSITVDTTSCLPDNTLVKLPNDPKVYVIIDCQKKWIQTEDEFRKNNYSWSDVKESVPETINSLPNYSGAVNDKQIADGAIIQADGDPDVYIVKYVGDRSFKRLVLNPSVFKSYGHLKWENIIKVDKSVLDGFTTSNLVRSAKSGMIYSLSPNGDRGVRSLIRDATILQRLGLEASSAYEINETDETSYEQGQDLE